MVVATSLADEILQLKAERHAVILAHHYQEPEIQEIADSIGDSLEFARAAQRFEGDVIAFCGVRFMAETAKVLNPERTVVLPDFNAGCSLVDSCPAEAVRAFRRTHPEHVDRQLHQYVGRSEGRKRHPLHIAQRCRDCKLHSRRKSRSCFCPTSTSATSSRSRPAARTCKSGRVPASSTQLSRLAVSPPPAPNIPKPSSLLIRSARRRAPHGRLHRLHFRHHRLVREAERRRIHRHDRKRRALLAGKAISRQALLLRCQRKLQLQRMPVHEAEHARKAARLLSKRSSPASSCPADIMRASARSHRAHAGCEVTQLVQVGRAAY